MNTYTVKQLRKLAKGKIKKYTRYNKGELAELLGIKINDLTYNGKYQKSISVISRNMETGEILKFKSLYAAGKYFGLNSQSIKYRIEKKKDFVKDDKVFSFFPEIQKPPKFELDKKALNVAKRFMMDLKKDGLSLFSPLSLLEEVKPLVLEKFKEFPNTKQQLTLQCIMKKSNPATGEIKTDEPHFHSHQHKFLEGSDFDEIFEKMKDKIILSFEKYMNESSQWNFQSGLKLFLNINKIKLLGASSYIPLPKFLKNKNAVINPENEDQKCFLWCIAIHKLLKENPNLRNPGRITKTLKRKAESFNVNGMKFPCEFSDINKFENNNNIAINVFGADEKEIFPLRISMQESDRVNILLMENNGERHYCLIKNMSRLLSSQFSKKKSKIHVCNYCLQKFGKEEILKGHLEYSSRFKCGKTVYPKKEETLKFKNYEKMHDIPFVVYADFECYLKPIDENIGENTNQFQKHEPYGYCYLIKCFDDDLFKPKLRQYTIKSEDEDISKHVRKIDKKFKFPKRMIFRDEDKKDFKYAEKCYACGKKIKN